VPLALPVNLNQYCTGKANQYCTGKASGTKNRTGCD
jgi:hypothetical protein